MNLPKPFTDRMKFLLGDQFLQYVSALDEKSVRGYRVNTEKISLEDFDKINEFGRRRIPFTKAGFYLENERAGSSAYHHAGAMYIQEPSAMAPAECVDIGEDWKILDLCAAPGGKSSHLHASLGSHGVLVSNEVIPSRCRVLTGNIERLGLKNTVVTCLEPSAVCAAFPKRFDLVAVDAPCSGEGMFRKNPQAIDQWSEQNVLMCARRQKEILNLAAKAVRDGGYIIYSTCTFSIEENEMVVDAFLDCHPQFKIVPVNKKVQEYTCDGIFFDGCHCRDMGYARRFYPHRAYGEGQFMAVLKNIASGERDGQAVKRRAEPEKAVFEFLDDTLEFYEKKNVILYKGRAVYFTPDFYVPDGLAFACGVTLSEPEKKYICPHHQFFMAMGKDFKRKIELGGENELAGRYIAGEGFETGCKNGWAAVTVSGCTLGGVKVVGGMAKNHYPKGLRRDSPSRCATAPSGRGPRP